MIHAEDSHSGRVRASRTRVDESLEGSNPSSSARITYSRNRAPMSQDLFLHLTTKLAWEDSLAVGVYSLSTKGKTLKEVGFIHGSFANQVEEVAGFVFAGSTEELVVLHLDTNKLKAAGIEVRVEDASNGKKYPHIYGVIPCGLVERVSAAYMNSENKLVIGKD